MNDFSFFFSRPGQNAALFRVILDGQFCGPHICALPHFFVFFFFDEHSGKLMTIFDVAVFVWLFELCLHVDVAANLSKKILSDLAGIEQVLTVRLLGVIFQSSLSFAAHVDYVLKVCSQCIFILKQLRAHCSGDATRTVAYSLLGNYSATLSLCSSSLGPFPQCWFKT